MTASDPTPDANALLSQIDDLIERYVELAARDAQRRPGVSLSTVPFDAREPQAALRTILSGWISQGPKVREFEAAFAAYVGAAHGIAVNSGSSANLLALTAAVELGDLATGDEVVIPATTFSTVASPVIQVGCVPVYADVELDTYDLSPRAFADAIGPRTRMVIAVHTLGLAADMGAIGAIAKDRGVVVMEDCCEAHGSSIDGRRVGTFGTVATSSFFVAHNMTTGEGGMILTNDARYAEMSRSLREFGRLDQRNVAADRYYVDELLGEYDRRYVFERLGYNVRMTDIAASFGVEQLRKLEAMNARRIENAAFLTARLGRHTAALRLPVVPKGYVHTYYTYPITVRPDAGFARNELCRYLESCGVETRPIFAGCLPDQPGFCGAPHRIAGDLRNARTIRDDSFFVGVHPSLGETELERIGDAFDRFFAGRPAAAS